MNSTVSQLLEYNLDSYVRLVNGAADRGPDVSEQIESIAAMTREETEETERRADVLARSVNLMTTELRLFSKRKSGAELGPGDDWEEDYSHAGGTNFLRVSFDSTMILNSVFQKFSSVLVDLTPKRKLEIPSGPNKTVGNGYLTLEEMQRSHFLAGMHAPAVGAYVSAVMNLDSMYSVLADASERSVSVLEKYYQALVKRHSVEGMEIHHNAVVTDVAIHVYENVDSEGEISMGRNPDELSAYSRRRAQVMADAIRDPFVHELMTSDGGLVEMMAGSLTAARENLDRVYGLLANESKDVRHLVDPRKAPKIERERSRINRSLVSIRDLDPAAVPFKEKTGLLTQDEKFRIRFKNETMAKIADMLVREVPTEEIIPYVLKRKEEIRKWFQEQNSFYTCSIGAGNPFLGVAPGAIQVVPSQRPNSSFDEIAGSGFPELKSFVKTIKGAAVWGDLFAATSPSKSADKSNILMIGPQGCGKTEAMRSIAAEKDSIAIFAVGSDFKTCWKDEGQKNPKRLFEHAIKLQKESQKHVHILIDEVDSVMCKKEFLSHGEDDLTTEFQNLMDGVVSYQNITVWGATNHPERMPMPIIRRFSKVLIVGELSEQDRAALLCRFFSYLPLDKGIGEGEWRSFSTMLEGATGDVLRKVADHVWRTKMQWFVDTMPEAATSVLDWLRKDGKFSVSDMTAEVRAELVSRLSEHFVVSAAEIRQAVDDHLKSLAIKTEISAAVAVYENAKKVVADVSRGLVTLS